MFEDLWLRRAFDRQGEGRRIFRNNMAKQESSGELGPANAG